MTPDYAPILGKVEGLDGFILNCGWGTWGFKAAPIAGKTVAELVSTGQTPKLIQPFGLDRFENGRLVNLACSRFWAQRLGVEALPGPSNFIMQGGDNSLEEMIASTKKGVLLTRFWYIRGLNPRIISYTGLSRDGTFLIEDGKIARPVTNFRFNQSLVSMLENVEMVGPAVRVAASENSSVNTAIVVPPVKASGFNLSSVSDAI